MSITLPAAAFEALKALKEDILAPGDFDLADYSSVAWQRVLSLA